MMEIYLTGAVSDWDDPFEWQRNIEQEFTDYAFVNPYNLNDHELGDEVVYRRPQDVVEPALDKVQDVDGVLVRWDDNAELVGTAIEIREAWRNDIPVVIWYVGNRDNVSPWLRYHSRAVFRKRDKSVKTLIMWAGDREVID